MSELELKITVCTAGSNVGDKVRLMYEDGENEDGIVLASNGYTLDVIKLERMDGLPLGVEEDFSNWIRAEHQGYFGRECEIAYKAYIAGRAVK